MAKGKRHYTAELKAGILREQLKYKDSLISEIVEDNLLLKKTDWGNLSGMWIEPEIRNQVTGYLCYMAKKTEIPMTKLLATLELTKVKYYRWIKRSGSKSLHNGQIPKTHWLTPNEVDAVIAFAKNHYTTNDFFIRDGYRRLAYAMLDKNVVAASPSSIYRILKKEGLLKKLIEDEMKYHE